LYGPKLLKESPEKTSRPATFTMKLAIGTPAERISKMVESITKALVEFKKSGKFMSSEF